MRAACAAASAAGRQCSWTDDLPLGDDGAIEADLSPAIDALKSRAALEIRPQEAPRLPQRVGPQIAGPHHRERPLHVLGDAAPQVEFMAPVQDVVIKNHILPSHLRAGLEAIHGDVAPVEGLDPLGVVAVSDRRPIGGHTQLGVIDPSPSDPQRALRGGLWLPRAPQEGGDVGRCGGCCSGCA